jgi:cell wall assembly regulator SMI1
MNFEQQLQQWVSIDNQMKILNDKMKELRDKKNTVSELINTHIETTFPEGVNNSIKIADGQIKFIKVKETQQLTFKYLETCLSEIIKNDEQVKKIVEYIKNKRDVKYIPEIKRIYNN